MAKATYEALQQIKHDGELIPVGGTIDLCPDLVARRNLVGQKVVRLKKAAAGKKAGAKNSSGKGVDPEPKGSGESSKNTPQRGKDPSGNAPAGGEPTQKQVGADDPAGDGAQPKGEAPGGKVDINTATKAELAATGLSSKAAGAVIGYRKKIAQAGKRFESVDQLTEVHGVGDETLAKVREKLIVIEG